MHKLEFIRAFNEISKADTETAGGKGASLGEMTSMGAPLPEGFVILSRAFEKFMEKTGISAEIVSVLSDIDYRDMGVIEDASKKLQSLIIGTDIPDEIGERVISAFKSLHTRFVAVRSSATSEDSKTAAWAGQLDSYLNTNEHDLLLNVKKCWASLFSPRAIFYRFERGFSDHRISVAVVVQKMVQSECAGVAFSVHPVTRERNRLLIEAGYGLGEAVVSGKITPDSYVIDKLNNRILGKVIGTQRAMLTKSKRGIGGNSWIKVPAEKGGLQKLSEEQILELAEVVIGIEGHYGFPVDVEWALEKDSFYITQCRPITTLDSHGTALVRRFEKFSTRRLPLMSLQFADYGQRVESPKHMGAYFTPLFHYTKRAGISFYYDTNNPETDVKPLFDYFKKNEKEFYPMAEAYKKSCDRVVRLAKEQKLSFCMMFHLMAEDVWPMLSATFILGRDNGDGELREVSKASYELRSATDKVEYIVADEIRRMLSKKFPAYKKYVDVITYEEASFGVLPPLEELDARLREYVYFEGKLYSGKGLRYVGRHCNIAIGRNAKAPALIKGKIVGSPAYGGVVRGVARVILSLSDAHKMKRGDILVTQMTTPEFLPLVEKASAIVTDEGGITCHAAIVARELKKPCVIGTGGATGLLKDGQRVEVNATDGFVKKL